MSSQKNTNNKSQRSSLLRGNSLRKSITKNIKRISSKLSKMGSSSNDLSMQASSKSLSSNDSSSIGSSLTSSQNRSTLLNSKTSELETIFKKHKSPFTSKLNLSFASPDNLGPDGSGYRIVGEYEEEAKNQKFPMDCIYGPYPDEVLLSGIDRFLHIIGMKSFVGKDFCLKELYAPQRLSLTSVSSASIANRPNNKVKDCKCVATDHDFTLIDVESLINKRLKSLQDALPKCLCDEETFKDLIKTMLPKTPSKVITKATITTDAPVEKKKSKHRKKNKKHGVSETKLTIESEIVHPETDEETASSARTTTTGDSKKSKSSHKKKSKSSIKSTHKPAKELKNIEFKETVSLNVLPPEPLPPPETGRCTCSLTECRMVPNIPPFLKSKLYYSARKHSVKRNKPKIVRTQWAFTKINVFDDTSRTFEVMRSMPKPPPQVVAAQTEIIFAVLPDGSTVCYDNIQRAKNSIL